MTVAGAAALMAEAERSTGLSDWGWYDIRTPLDALVRSVNSQGALSTFGDRACQERLSFVLANRLRMIDDRKRLPRIADEEIRRPIIIPGLPRSGTTILLQLLAQDPANRSARTWEALAPSPPPGLEGGDAGGRIGEVQGLLERAGLTRPELMAIHPFGAEIAEECIFICEHAMTYTPYGAMWHAPDYAAYGAGADMSAVFQVHKEVLQHLQYGAPARRWVLKAPTHMFHLPTLAQTYPDAVFIQTHRDPGRIIPSLAKLFGALRGLYSDDPGKADVVAAAQAQLESWARGLEAMAEFRRQPGMDGRFVDVDYKALLERPLETIGRIYAALDLPLPDDATSRMRDWLAANTQHKHGAHAYSLAECGLSARDIEQRYGGYMERFQVTREERR
jgi:hypothetical protein